MEMLVKVYFESNVGNGLKIAENMSSILLVFIEEFTLDNSLWEN